MPVMQNVMRIIPSILSGSVDGLPRAPRPAVLPHIQQKCRKDIILNKYGQTILGKSVALAMAAAIAVTAAGCSGGTNAGSAPANAPQAATESAATPAGSAAAENTSAAAASDDSTAAPAGTAASSAAASESTDSAATSATAAQTAAPDTALKESLLGQALTECVGWGQSAGSSLRAATASVLLLQWANEADAAKADSTLLADTVKAEVKRLSKDQLENLKDNWSTISFDASMVLDSFDEISPILEDAGCAEAAKEISNNKDTLANWEALEHALDAALK